MKLSRLLFALTLLFAGLVLPAAAQDQKAALARMDQRLAKVVSLKASGSIGENNKGLVEVRSPGGDAASVVADENRDREEVYAAVAKSTGSTPDAVGKARAKSIAANSAAGTWLHRDDGSLYKK